MSESFEGETENLSKEKPEYMKDEVRDMRTEKNYSEDETEDEAQNQDTESDWSKDHETPLAGRMAGSMEQLERMQSSEVMTSEEVRECLRDSLDCYQTCIETITRCLNMGGKHAEFEHLNLLMDCAKICSTNADFIIRNSTYYPQTCGITADICDECADNCDRFDEDFMKECASVCRRCAESCREMAR